MQNNETVNRVWFDLMNHASLDLFKRDVALVDDADAVRAYECLVQTDKDKIDQILVANSVKMMNYNHLIMISRF